MNGEQFLKELNVKLKYLPEEDRANAIRFYDEYISEMELADDEDVVARLGTPKEVASDIISQCTQKHMSNTQEQKTVRGSAKTIWLIILGILTLPFSLPIAIVAFTFVFVVVVMIITAFVIAIVGAIAIPWSLFVPGIAQKIYTLGYGFMCLGMGILFTYATTAVLKKIFNSITSRKRARMVINE
ncbi:MAG: DUF1700 domain-containing protein [Butyrivibrio sp.]|nr:DUF1700 domain-containing protein [Butyrivibrio sp.]